MSIYASLSYKRTLSPFAAFSWQRGIKAGEVIYLCKRMLDLSLPFFQGARLSKQGIFDKAYCNVSTSC